MGRPFMEYAQEVSNNRMESKKDGGNYEKGKFFSSILRLYLAKKLWCHVRVERN